MVDGGELDLHVAPVVLEGVVEQGDEELGSSLAHHVLQVPARRLLFRVPLANVPGNAKA